MTKLGDWLWHELNTTDTGEARNFYRDLFGWGSAAMPMPGDPGAEPYTIWQHGGTGHGGMGKMPAEMHGAPPHWLIYVHVDNVDDSAALATKLGGRIVMSPLDIPTVGRMAVIADPAGAHIAMMKPAPMPAPAKSTAKKKAVAKSKSASAKKAKPAAKKTGKASAAKKKRR